MVIKPKASCGWLWRLHLQAPLIKSLTMATGSPCSFSHLPWGQRLDWQFSHTQLQRHTYFHTLIHRHAYAHNLRCTLICTHVWSCTHTCNLRGTLISHTHTCSHTHAHTQNPGIHWYSCTPIFTCTHLYSHTHSHAPMHMVGSPGKQPPSLGSSKVSSITWQQTPLLSQHSGKAKGFRGSGPGQWMKSNKIHIYVLLEITIPQIAMDNLNRAFCFVGKTKNPIF